MYIFVTGRESNLALAEIEAVFGVPNIIDNQIASVETESLELSRLDYLGFSKKVALVISENISRHNIADEISKAILEDTTSSGKLSFGISWMASPVCDRRYYIATAKSVKKSIQTAGRSARFVQPKEGFELNSAQVQFNSLLKKGCEVIVFGSGDNLGVAITKWVFDPTGYSKRDYDRPARSAKVGMFPPKLAQVLINLSNAKPDEIVCDPFCGSGVVLQEAMNAGHNVEGSDSSSEMVAAAKKNLEWFARVFNKNQSNNVIQADARDFRPPNNKYVIVSEGYLGPALSERPNESLLLPIKSNLEKLYLDFLREILQLQHQPQRIVITIPVWQTINGLSYLKVIDQIGNLGYTLRQFDSVNNKQLIYRRPDQTVGRQVLVLEPLKNSINTN